MPKEIDADGGRDSCSRDSRAGRYGGGRVVKPMRLIIGDRATLAKGVDVGEVAVEAAREWFREKFPEIDPDRPQMASVQVRLAGETKLAAVVEPIQRIVRHELSRMPVFCQELAEGRHAIC